MRPALLALFLLLAAPRAGAETLREQALAAGTCLVEQRAAACVAPLAQSAELRAAFACALRGGGTAGCFGIEAGLLGACLLAGGGSMEATAGCLALRLAAREAAKCLEGGVFEASGCLGPGHELRRWARGAGELGARARAWWRGPQAE